VWYTLSSAIFLLNLFASLSSVGIGEVTHFVGLYPYAVKLPLATFFGLGWMGLPALLLSASLDPLQCDQFDLFFHLSY
jgi:hypothetical protein